MTRYRVTIGEQALLVSLRREGDALYARVGEAPEVLVRLDPVRAGLYALRVGDARTELLAERTDAGARVALGGLTYDAAVEDDARARLTRLAGGASAQAGRADLKAPMPGLVVKVLVEPGQHVERGQPLVVLQAMKMENELSLPHAGQVKAVHAAAGQTVEQGQVLVVLERGSRCSRSRVAGGGSRERRSETRDPRPETRDP